MDGFIWTNWDWEYRYIFLVSEIIFLLPSSFVKTSNVERVKILGFKSAKVDASVVTQHC